MKVEARKQGMFGRRYTLRLGGSVACEMEHSLIGGDGKIVCDGNPFEVRSQGLFSRTWELRQGREVLATGRRSAFGGSVELELGRIGYALKRSGFFSSGFDVMQASVKVGSLKRASLFSRDVVGDLPESWAPQHSAFAIWLVVAIWRRRARSSS